jgi:hypothetical protein
VPELDSILRYGVPTVVSQAQWGHLDRRRALGISENELTGTWLEQQGANGLVAIFHEDGGSGYFFAYRPATNEVIEQVRIYKTGSPFRVLKQDVKLLWSSNFRKCAAVIWGQVRAVIDTEIKAGIVAALTSRASLPLTDASWLSDFQEYLDEPEFINARQSYWKQMLEETKNLPSGGIC